MTLSNIKNKWVFTFKEEFLRRWKGLKFNAILVEFIKIQEWTKNSLHKNCMTTHLQCCCLPLALECNAQVGRTARRTATSAQSAEIRSWSSTLQTRLRCSACVLDANTPLQGRMYPYPSTSHGSRSRPSAQTRMCMSCNSEICWSWVCWRVKCDFCRYLSEWKTAESLTLAQLTEELVQNQTILPSTTDYGNRGFPKVDCKQKWQFLAAGTTPSGHCCPLQADRVTFVAYGTLVPYLSDQAKLQPSVLSLTHFLLLFVCYFSA